MELARSFPFSLSVTAPLGFEDNPCDGAIGYKASLPSYCSSCFEESSVLSSAASILFSSPAQPQCDSPMSQPHFNVVWPVGEPNLPPALDRSILHVRQSIAGDTPQIREGSLNRT
uniref:Uncharacterized protein n=1 Tax=Brassica oleracea TaxID=3712 RepID=A0A3P6DHA2_BRAOL|nr:unnamed protein product [Brassica oleracea]